MPHVLLLPPVVLETDVWCAKICQVNYPLLEKSPVADQMQVGMLQIAKEPRTVIVQIALTKRSEEGKWNRKLLAKGVVFLSYWKQGAFMGSSDWKPQTINKCRTLWSGRKYPFSSVKADWFTCRRALQLHFAYFLWEMNSVAVSYFPLFSVGEGNICPFNWTELN